MLLNKKNNQYGTALITALLFMALITTLVTAIAFRQSLNLEQTQLILDSNRLWLAEKIMVAKAESKLALWLNASQKDVAILKKNYDELGNFKPIKLNKVINNINLNTTILDAQAYLDINSLSVNKETTGPSTSPSVVTLTINNLYLKILKYFSNTQYLNLLKETESYVLPRSVNTKKSNVHIPMTSISEIRLLPSMTGKLYQNLFNDTEPLFLFALPVIPKKTPNKINLNTISSELFHILLKNSQLKLINRPFTEDDLLSLNKDYTNYNDIFSLNSNYYLIKTEAENKGEGIITIMYSLIQITDNQKSDKKQFQLIWFSQGTI